MATNLEDEDYIDEILPSESVAGRASTAAERREAYTYRQLAQQDEPQIPVEFSKNDEALYRLQVVVLKRLPNRANQTMIQNVMESRTLNSDVFATFYHGFRRKVIDPNLALLEACKVACAPSAMFDVEKQYYIQIVALALRFGADPNQYVDVGEAGLIHIVYWVHRLSERERVDYGYDSVATEEYVKTQIIALMILAGSNVNLPNISADTSRTTTTKLLLDYPDGQRSVIYNMELDRDEPRDDEQQRLNGYIQGRLLRVNEVTRLRSRPEDLPKEYPEEWSADETLQLLYMYDYAAIAGQVEVDAITGELNDVSLVHSHAVYLRYLERLPSGAIPSESERLLDASTKFLDVTSVDLLLMRGAIPTYELKDAIINRIRKIRPFLPLTADIDCQILFLFARYGYTLDDAQIKSFGKVSPHCASKLQKYASEHPAWKGECAVQYGDPSQQLRELARETNVDPSLSKLQICTALGTLAAEDPDIVENIAKRRQAERLRVSSGTLVEAVKDERAYRTSRQDKRGIVTSVPVNTLPNTTASSVVSASPNTTAPNTTVSSNPSSKSPSSVRVDTNVRKGNSKSSNNSNSVPQNNLDESENGEENGEEESEVKQNSNDKEKLKLRSDYVRGECHGDVCTFEAGEDVVETVVKGTADSTKHSGKKNRKREAKKSAKKVIVQEPEIEEEKKVDVEEKKVEEEEAPPEPLAKTIRSRQPISKTVGSRQPVTRGVLSPVSLKSGAALQERGLTPHGKGTLNSTKSKICVNQAGLRFPPETYSDLDIVVYDDSKSRTWCFTSEDYAALIEAKINPETDEPLPKAVINEMEVKLKTLQDQGVKVTPTDIGTGVRKLKSGGYAADTTSSQTLQRLKDYYVLAGLDTALIIEGYTITDMQSILDGLYDPAPVLDTTSRNHAMYSYASAITRDIDSAPDPNVRFDEVFNYISAYGT